MDIETKNAKARTREELKNRATSYEVVLKSGRFKVRLGFTARLNHKALYEMTLDFRDTITRDQMVYLAGTENPEMEFKKITSNKVQMTFGDIVVYTTGRTEKQVANEEGST